MQPILLGMMAGIAGAIVLGQYLEHLISSAEPLELSNCAIAVAFLLVTALLAVWSATARILSIDS